MKEHKDTPFKATVRGVRCIVIVGASSARIDFTGYGKIVEIPYSKIRTIRISGKVIRIDTQKENGLLCYLIASGSAKKMYKAIFNSIVDWRH